MTARTAIIVVVGLLLALAIVVIASRSAAQDVGLAERGREIVARDCSRCHAIDTVGASPLPAAPAFRSLSAKYPLEHLAEALAEGIVAGHPDMPQRPFEPEDVAAILAHLSAISER